MNRAVRKTGHGTHRVGHADRRPPRAAGTRQARANGRTRPDSGGKVRVEVSAGGIVYKHSPHGIQIAFILDPFGKWAFAKGHVEKGETVLEGALRETREEMGLGRLEVKAELGKIDFWFRDRYRPENRGVLIHKHVHFFLMEAPPHAQGQPQKKERIRKIIWVDLGRALAVSGYKDVRPMLMRVKAYFAGKPLPPVSRKHAPQAR